MNASYRKGRHDHHELGRPLLGTGTAGAMGWAIFFPVAQPATGDYAERATEIAKAAKLENDPHRPLLKGGTDLCESRYGPPTSHPLLPNCFQQHLWVSYHGLLPETLLTENSIWSSKGGERRAESRSPKGVFSTRAMVSV